MGKPLVVCELGLNCQGSIKTAKALIGLAASYGADFVKLQKRCDLDAIYTQEYLDKPVTDERLFKWGKTIREQREFLEFDKDEYDEIDAYCRKVGIGWFASVWDLKAVEFMEQYNPPLIKIPSVAATNHGLREAAVATGRTLILSGGMLTREELRSWLNYTYKRGTGGRADTNLKHVLHCTPIYPASNTQMNMNRLAILQSVVNGWCVGIGFSNHCTDIIHIIQAAVMGASMVEFHITLDRNMDGPDHRASIGPMGFKRIMDHLDNIEKAWGSRTLEPSEKELAKGRHYLWR